MCSLKLLETISSSLDPLAFLPLFVVPPSLFSFSIFYFAGQQIHQFVSSFGSELFENLFSFVIRAIRVFLWLVKPCFLSHSHVMGLHVFLQTSSKLTISIVHMFLQFFCYLRSMIPIYRPDSLALFFSCLVSYHVGSHPNLRTMAEPYCSILVF